MTPGRVGLAGVALTVSGIALLAVGSFASPPGAGSWSFGMGGPGPMGAHGATGMMGGTWNGSAPPQGPGPGGSGFVAGTAAAPRVVAIVATPTLRFVPDSITVMAGETITFEVRTDGPVVHEFMLGPAADVAADVPGTPEIADLTATATGSLTYTFAGSGPFAFACHAPGHYEAGMVGTIVISPG